MGTGASKNPLRSTANAGIIASKWGRNARSASSSTASTSGSTNLAPDNNIKLVPAGTSDDKDVRDLKAEGRWGILGSIYILD